MIQMTNSRRGSSAVAPRRQSTSSSAGQSWGTWYNHRFYTLEIVQQPIRARMCGFGDKDRRPLAPAVVAKMVVRNEDDSLVEEDDIDTSFFIATADLWDSDGHREMNLVLHPTSSDRYVATQPPKRRRGTGSGPSFLSPGEPPNTGPPPLLSSPDNPPYDPPHSGFTPLAPAPPSPGFNAPLFTFPQPRHPPSILPSHHSQSQTLSFQPIQPYNAIPSPPSWGYQPPYSPVPSISRTAMAANNVTNSLGSHAWHSETSSPIEPSNSYRSWGAPPPLQQPHNAAPAPMYGQITLEPAPVPVSLTSNVAAAVLEPTYRRAPSPLRYVDLPAHEETSGSAGSGSGRGRGGGAGVADVYGRGSPNAGGATSTSDARAESPEDQQSQQGQTQHSMYASASYGQWAPRQNSTSISGPSSGLASGSGFGGGAGAGAGETSSTIPPLPRHTYTRTLVGLLTANASRLQDEHRKPGVFFLFQDLSIRTEGPFRLRLRLMNIGAGLPGSENAAQDGALHVHTDVSPVLAQVFTDKFDVYSAKRFPGVPDTTALSISFGNQGQKLPLRNRHGSSKRRRGRGNDGSDDDSSDG